MSNRSRKAAGGKPSAKLPNRSKVIPRCSSSNKSRSTRPIYASSSTRRKPSAAGARRRRSRSKSKSSRSVQSRSSGRQRKSRKRHGSTSSSKSSQRASSSSRPKKRPGKRSSSADKHIKRKRNCNCPDCCVTSRKPWIQSGTSPREAGLKAAEIIKQGDPLAPCGSWRKRRRRTYRSTKCEDRGRESSRKSRKSASSRKCASKSRSSSKGRNSKGQRSCRKPEPEPCKKNTRIFTSYKKKHLEKTNLEPTCKKTQNAKSKVAICPVRRRRPRQVAKYWIQIKVYKAD